MEEELPLELGKVEALIDTSSHPWVTTLVVVALVIVAMGMIHVALHFALTRVTRPVPLMHALVNGTRGPMRWTLIAAGLTALFNVSPDDLVAIEEVRHGALLLLIGGLTWVAVAAVRSVGAGVLDNYGDGNGRGEYHARRVQTQTRVLVRILGFLIGLVGVAGMLMTFPGVRQIGASMMASAGVAGLVIGFAARPVLSNLLAGLQIALTQPIRIGDVVIVENEWGWIEQIFSTYVVVRVWDERRLVVPLNYFIETPFQNWTRDSSQLIGGVHWWVDYRMPLQPMRDELKRLCETAPEWDGRAQLIQVVDASDRAIQLRALVSAPDAPKAWDLRCRVREGMVDFIQREYPQFLPQIRSDLVGAERTTAVLDH
ncbi:mechanosensitive ion channel family protein [Nitrogeniibacter aestuarii]|uniref:mechanosensitive ion channel family protein n=1 Tax=Nitrogeniibacter aestuarii TaxID=2815343 RepID=UPI001E386B16|nr:mechanosensitive ion channel domain-containing protein [Nitrogeniibacter aestuarii]